jgi:hypothetical protein
VNVRIAVPVIAVSAVLVAVSAARPAVEPPPAVDLKKIERGRQLVWTVGCNDCHTPKTMGPRGPELDQSRLLSGHRESPALPAPPSLPKGPWGIVTSLELTAWSGPWGVSYAPNLTPDETTGLGIWTEEMFVQALRTGRHMGTSRPILPPMPWQVYGQMPEQDLKAIYAYLRSLPPVRNRVPEPVIVEQQ